MNAPYNLLLKPTILKEGINPMEKERVSGTVTVSIVERSCAKIDFFEIQCDRLFFGM